MTIATSTFIDQLLKSRVRSPEEVREFVGSCRCSPDADEAEIATVAVRGRFLTRFQAEEILNGRGRRLRIADLVLTDVLGFGGMGTVYVAHRSGTDERLAVKLLGEKFKHDSGMCARFRLEATAGMQLDHPRLVKTYELGKMPDLYGEIDYMVMELVEGVTLLEGVSFSDGPMKWDAACDVICQAAEGLGFLHERGMVHRDVKPDNILIDVGGEAKLLDFGLTLADQAGLEEEFSLAMIFGHDCLGTADFIPPEQSQDSLHVDGRADVYSLGCTLFLALTARRPFSGPDRTAIVRAHRDQPRPCIRDFNTQVPRELSEIVERMMSIDPQRRPQTMADVIQELTPYRKRRNWAFEFSQVLAQRRYLRRLQLSKSRILHEQAARPTKVNSRLETDAPGVKRSEPENDVTEI